MNKLSLILTAYVALNCSLPAQLAFAQEFLLGGSNKIRGYDADLGVNYSVQKDRDTYRLRLVVKQKIITLLIDYRNTGKEFFLLGIDQVTGEIAMLDRDETEILAGVLKKNLKHPEQNSMRGVFSRALNLLASWPPDLPLNIKKSFPAAVGGPRVDLNPGFEDICGKVNQLHQGRYPVRGTWETFSPREVGPFPWEQDECTGRCGRGCAGDGPPNNGIYVFSQDCFNHDVCVADQGYFSLDCMTAFDETFDDFLFGRSCQKDNLDLIINGQDNPVEINRGDSIAIDVSIRNVVAGMKGDYYLSAETDLGYYSYTHADGWKLAPYPQPYFNDRKLYQVETFNAFTGFLPDGFPTGLSNFFFGYIPSSGPVSGQFEDVLEVNVAGQPPP